MHSMPGLPLLVTPMVEVKAHQAHAQSVQFLLAEGSDFPLERNNLPSQLKTKGFETLRVFESLADETELQRLKLYLTSASLQFQRRLLLIFTSKRAAQAVADFSDTARLIEKLDCSITSVGQETHQVLQQVFSRACQNVLPPARLRGLQACIDAHAATYPCVVVAGTPGGLSEKIIDEMNQTELEKKYHLFNVYRTKVTEHLTDTLLRIFATKQKQSIATESDTAENCVWVLCCASGTAVRLLEHCILETAVLKNILGKTLFFLPLGPSAQRAVKLSALPSWNLPCEDVSMQD